VNLLAALMIAFGGFNELVLAATHIRGQQLVL
jgi:hypothetical protein